MIVSLRKELVIDQIDDMEIVTGWPLKYGIILLRLTCRHVGDVGSKGSTQSEYAKQLKI